MAPLLRHIPHRPRVPAEDLATGAPRRPRRSAKGFGWLTIVAVVLCLVAQTASAAPGVRGDAVIDQAQKKKEDIRREKAELAGKLDAANASTEEVAAALDALDGQVYSQQAKVNESSRAIEAAERRIAELQVEIDQNRGEVDRITAQLRSQALRRYVKPEGDVDTTQLLKSDNFDEAEQRKALAEIQWGNSHDSIDQLRGAKAHLADLQAQSDAAKDEATSRRSEQQSQLDSLNASRSAQARVKAEWDARVAKMEAEESHLIAADSQLTQLISNQQAKIAQEAAAAKAAQQKQAQQVPTGGSGGSGGSTTGNRPTAPAPPPPNAPGGGGGRRFIWPMSGRVSQEFHGGHAGMDIFAPLGTPVWAASSGTVIYAEMNSGGYGNLVLVDHGGGVVTAYAHLSQIGVSVGQSVGQGQGLGAEGNTGRSTGPHLHFEVRVGGSAVNPRGYLP